MSRKNQLKRFAVAVSGKYGKGTVGLGVRVAAMERLRTGSLALDFALGGGVPIGRTTMLYGEKSSGKTTTSYRIAGNAQKMCANCLRTVEYEVVELFDETTGEVDFEQKGECDCFSLEMFEANQYPDEKKQDFNDRVNRYKENSYEPYTIALIDMEGAFDHQWAANLGLDERTVVYVRPDTAEEAIDIYDSLMRTGAVDMFILDSIAALTPSKEVEESMEKWQQGLQARLVNKFVRKVQASANSVYRDYGRMVTQIWINQVREKIGVMFGDNTTVPGGKGQGFATSVEVKMWTSAYEVETVAELPGKDKDLALAKSVRVNFRIEKNKTAPPKATGSYVMKLSDGYVDEFKLVYSLCERFNMIEKVSAVKWRLGDLEFKSKGQMMDALRDNHDEYFDLLLGKMLSV